MNEAAGALRNAKRPGRRASLHDVARLAGVSAAAVSYVVNGRTGEVSATTLRTIQEAIGTLKYQPQRRGLSLRTSRDFAIGLIVVDPSSNFLSDPFTTQVATGISNALTEPGYGLTVTGCGSVDDLVALLKRPIGLDAFVVLASGPPSTRQRIYRHLGDVSLPLIVIQDEPQRSVEDCCAIRQDDFGGAALLARHLLDRQVERILFVAPERAWPAVERREAGIRSVLPPSCAFTKVGCDENDFHATMAVIEIALGAGPMPDAVMGANDQIAMEALRVLRERRIKVPHEVQVTGYNGFAFRNYVTPLLTTVTSSALQIGERCAEVVLARLDAGAFATRSIAFPCELNVGGTTLAHASRSGRPTARSPCPQ